MSNKILCLALCAVLPALNFPAAAQQAKKIPRIGIVGSGDVGSEVEALRQGLRDLDYIECTGLILNASDRNCCYPIALGSHSG